MKAYAAIGHCKGRSNINCIAGTANTKKEFEAELRGNGFVVYAVLTEKKLRTLPADDTFGIYEQVKKLTSNYRVWDTVADYLDQRLDIIVEKLEEAKSYA